MSFDPTRRFTLKDSEGVEHEYEIALVPPSQGMAMQFQLMALVVEPLAPLLGGVASSVMASIDSAAPGAKIKDIDFDLEALVGALDFGAVGATLSSVVARIPPSLIRQLIGTAHRDRQSLKGQGAFDAAYQGNYMELYRAVAKIVQLNGFLPASDTIANALGAARGQGKTAPSPRASGAGGASLSTLPGEG